MISMRIFSLLARRSSSLAAPASNLSAELSRTPTVLNENELGDDDTSKSLSEACTFPDGKVKEKQFALLLSYLGENYSGLQYNAHRPSIEQELFQAVVKSGIATEKDARNPGFYLKFTRGSRTDKGVSALRQVISMKLPLDFDKEAINKFLPPDIRILGVKRVTKSFDAQKACCGRSYCYIMPTYALCHYKNISYPYENYRIDADSLLKANEIFQVFNGSHKFHNYTEKRDIWDHRSVRRINQASVSNAFLVGNLELVEFHVQGQSFMLHQIRRMIGMVIAIMRGKATDDQLQNTFVSPAMPTPTAPSLGLMLEKQHFDWYNRCMNQLEPLEWHEYDADVEKFKMEYVVPNIVQKELQDGIMQWFLDEKLRKHSFKIKGKTSKLESLGNWDLDELSSDMAEPQVLDKSLQTETR